MISAGEIRQKLQMLSRDELSLNAFENWLEPYMWDMESDGSQPDALELVYSIQSMFSERNNLRLDKKSLRRHLTALVNDAVFSIQFAPDWRAVSVPHVAISEWPIFSAPDPQSRALVHQLA